MAVDADLDQQRPWGAESAFLVDTGSVRERVALAAGGWRRTQVINTFEQGTGLLTASSDLGDADPVKTDDDRCTRTYYAKNTGSWMLNYVSRVEVVGVACSAQASFPVDLLSEVRMFYDNKPGNGDPPVTGDVTRTEEASGWVGSVRGYQITARARHDEYGRVLESWDAAGERSTMAYTPVPNAAGPVARTTATNPLGHSVTTDVDGAWVLPTRITDANQRKTELVYDGLGRLTKVWLPGRPKATFPQSPSSEFEYRVQTAAANVVTSKTLRPDGVGYNYSYAFFDGLLRARQTQTASPGLTGGRIINESFYDLRGLVWKANGPYFNGAPPDIALVTPVNDQDVPAQTLTVSDGVGRNTRSGFKVLGQERWFTTTTYGGDRVNVDPPAGATPMTTITNARGKVVELRQYATDAPIGTNFQTTKYGYTDRDELARVTDPANNVWTYTYDLRGLKIETTDPDKGATTFGYDSAGRLTSTRDARDVTLAYAYDKLGRKTAVHEGSLAGPKRAEWVFDTLPGGVGLPTSSTRFEAGHAYVSAVNGYEQLSGLPTGSTVTIPAAEGPLAGSYRTESTYKPDGSPDTVKLPGVGGLPGETLTVGYNTLGLPATLSSTVNPLVKETGYSEYGELGQLTMSTAATGKKHWQTFFYELGTRRLERDYFETQTAVRQQADIRYSYDLAGNLTRVADLTVNQTADVQCFRQDHLQRLTVAWTPATDNCTPNPTTAGLGGPAAYWHSYRYDTVGNRISEVAHAAAGDTTRTYTYPAGGHAHGLASVTTTRPGAPTTTDSYGYNQTGDTASRAVAGQPGHTLTWDPEGRLASDTAGGQTTSFVYDANGARLVRRDPTHTTLYLPDGTEMRCQRPAGPVVGTRYYSHAGRTIAARTGGVVTWLAADHHGTHNYAINATDLAVTRRRSMPFGAPRGAQPAWPGERGFVGGTVDASTGLTHLGAREYDPTLGRFVSVDPLMDLADPQQMHGYTYANNNPTTHSDPSGLWCDSCNNGNGWPYVGGYEPDNPAPAGPLPPGKGLANDLATKTSERGSKDPAAKRRQAIRDYADIRCAPDGIRGVNICSIPGYEPHSLCLGKEYNMFVWCLEQNPGGKEKLRFREGFGEFIADITGLTDIAECSGGDVGACAFAAAGILPWAKVAKIFKGLLRGSRTAKGVWSSIRATDDVYEGTAIPRSFELTTANGDRIWVAPNASEHMAERVVARSNSPELAGLASQVQLDSLNRAVSAATANGIPMNQMVRVGGWELMFGPSKTGPLPALFHARQYGG